MRKADGNLATSDSDNADIMGEHFTKVFNNHRLIDSSVLDELKQKPIIESLVDQPTEVEFDKALRNIANGKIPGESGIKLEALKGLLDEEHIQIMRDFLNTYWTDPTVDFEEWHRNSLCALRKTGKGKDYGNPNNWRGICLAEIPAKIQSSIISSRLLEHLKLVGIETQYGCASLAKDAQMPYAFAIKNALQMRQQHGQDSWAVFVDLVKAFDMADHKLLFAILKKSVIPDTLITVIEKMYTYAIVVFKTGTKTR
eukprot:scaffold217553_cov44-Attheya_sp.AAC.1